MSRSAPHGRVAQATVRWRPLRAVVGAVILSSLAAVLGSAAPPALAAGPPPSGGNPPPNTGTITSRPNDFPHPVHPWNSLTRPEIRGQAIGYIAVPPQEVAIVVLVSALDGAPSQWGQQVIMIPGYYVTETTTGYLYPERWTLDQRNVGVYQWRLLPPEFRRK